MCKSVIVSDVNCTMISVSTMTRIRACGEVRKGLEKPEGVPAKKVVAEAGGGVGRGRNGLNLSDSGGGGGGGGTPGENGCGGGGLNDVSELKEIF